MPAEHAGGRLGPYRKYRVDGCEYGRVHACCLLRIQGRVAGAYAGRGFGRSSQRRDLHFCQSDLGGDRDAAEQYCTDG